MKILVTGAGGQVGGEAVTEAARRGHHPVGTTRADLDLADADAVEAIIRQGGFDAVLNAAAFTAVDLAETETDAARRVNALAPRLFGEVCASLDIPLVHYSTDYVFDGTATTPYREDHPTAPINAYGQTKLMGEEAILEAGANAAIIRLAWVFAGHGKNFVRTMLRVGAERDTLKVVDDQRGKPTPARDAAIAGILALERLAEKDGLAGIYHYSGDEETSWAGFARAIFEIAGMDTKVEGIPTSEFPTPARRPAYSVMATDKIQDTFGVEPADWRARLEEAIAEIRENAA